MSLYIAVWGRAAPGETAQNSSVAPPAKPVSAVGPATKTRAVPAAPGEIAPGETAPGGTAPGETDRAENAPDETAPVEAGPVETGPVETAPVETAAVGALPPAASAPFPQPSSYGVYAITNNALIELQRAAAAPANPRSGNPLQIVTPSRTTIAAPGLTFVVYQRDLAARAPELVKVRIAARLSQSMNYDSRGRAVVTKPPVATWIIRDQGYDLRASSVRGSADMLVLRPVNTESSSRPAAMSC